MSSMKGELSGNNSRGFLITRSFRAILRYKFHELKGLKQEKMSIDELEKTHRIVEVY